MFDSSGTSPRTPRGGVPPDDAPARPTPLRIRVACSLIGATGIVLVVVSSFLPWVISGTVRRSSYAIVGILGRLGIGENGPIGFLLGAWPLIGLLCMAPIAAAGLRWWRVSGVLAVLLAIPAGLLSFGVLIATSSLGGGGIGVDPIGPAIMGAGAVLLFCGGLALALGAGSPIRRNVERSNADR